MALKLKKTTTTWADESSKDHPAAICSTLSLYHLEEIFARTHTSPVQARRFDAYDFQKVLWRWSFYQGKRVFRRDTDDVITVTTYPNRRLGCWENISILTCKERFVDCANVGEERQIRLFWPIPIHRAICWVWCFFKCGEGWQCVCKKTGWIEIQVPVWFTLVSWEMSGIDATVYSGFGLWSYKSV